MKLPDSAPASFEIAVLPGPKGFAEAGAREFARAASAAIDDRGIFRVALAGGSTPRALYRNLARSPHRRSIRWSLVRFFWGDERCVPPEDEKSNYRMARETLLQPLKIPARQVFRMKADRAPAQAARDYEETLRGQFRGRPARMDLVLLGLGKDGHTASLFPGTQALAEERRLVVANFASELSQWRITLTYPAINAARRVVFLVAGAEKAVAAAKILKKQRSYQGMPASGVAPSRGTLLWLLDEAAASKL